jgi:hypothetical protein
MAVEQTLGVTGWPVGCVRGDLLFSADDLRGTRVARHARLRTLSAPEDADRIAFELIKEFADSTGRAT